MTTASQQERPASGDEAEIAALITAWSEALEAKNVDGLAANCAPDILLFDVKAPFQMRGIKAYRKVWQDCLPHFPAKMRSERRDLSISVGNDVAFAHCLHRIVPQGEKSPAGETWMRVTVCYRKIGGKWLSVHEHVSLPFDPTTGRAVFMKDGDFAAN